MTIRKRITWLIVAACLPLLTLAAGYAVYMDSDPKGFSDLSGLSILIDAVLYDGYETSDADEAVYLFNIGNAPADVGGWQLSDGSASKVTLAAGTVISPGAGIWLTKDGSAFRRQFGFNPAFETTNTDPLIPDLTGTWPGFANDGDEVILLNAAGAVIDVLVYKDGDTAQTGWSGSALEPYLVSSVFGEEGQLLYRRRDPLSGLPVPDTGTAADWAQSTGDVINGRKVRYPGWDLDAFFYTARVTETAVLTVAIAPDNAYDAIVQQIDSAGASLQITSLSFEHVGIADALVRARQRGVLVTVLLEGEPPGGITDQERYVCQQVEAAGGQCWFMFNDDSQAVFDRYDFLHAKYILVDNARVVISSENLSPNSLPDDDKNDGTWGRRGVVLMTDAPGVVGRVQALFAADYDPANHVDLFRWTAGDPLYGAPTAGFVPITQTGGITYSVRFSEAAEFRGTFAFEVVQAPESSLREVDALLGLVGRAGEGDTLLVQQLSERPYWGKSDSNAIDDPNPRLEAHLDAARRGATVRLLLDNYYDDLDSATSNAATCAAVNIIAHAERLDLECATANPTGLGIHNKMVLAQIDGRGYLHIGSLNGTEQANKDNREVALQAQSDEAYNLLAKMFYADWPYRQHLPALFHGYIGRARNVLISEVLYDPSGLDDKEFIELVNPTGTSLDLSNFSLGDAVLPTDFEDVRRFPVGTMLAPGQTLVVATAATSFFVEHGFNPDFEILATDPAVPDLIDDLAWGDPAAFLQLGNTGDEVILRDAAGQPVDVVTYGDGTFTGVVGCALVPTSGYSLERFPYWRDTDSCTADFRAWPFPNPGDLPE